LAYFAYFAGKISGTSVTKLRISIQEAMITMREPLLAGLLSLLVPGVGQIYNGRIIVGILWLVLTGVSWIGSAGLLGWVVHLISAWCAYSYAKDNPIRS
jgi:TM2 domain-containing membrane protein YozV